MYRSIVARINGFGEDQFVEAISASDLTTFALEPVTLTFLVNSYQSGKLSTGKVNKIELFEEGLRHLCTEFNPSYKHRVALTPEQRFRIASRLAAYSIFSNRPTFWMDEDRLQANPNDFLSDDAVNDKFRIGEGTSEHITIGFLREVFNTALFSLHENNRLGWKHRTYVEFLAAWHLSAINIHPRQIQQLITSPYDYLKAIPPLQEVVVWLASMNRGVFDLLKFTEPMLLLRCHHVFNEADSADLVEAMFKRADAAELIDGYENRKYYNKLNYTGLAEVLRPFITDKSKNVVVRRIAIDIAGTCKVDALSTDLLSVVADKGDESHLRKKVIDALGAIGNATVLPQLREYALVDQPEDKDDELKGAALKALYPACISTREMIDCLTKLKKRNLYAAYHGFLSTVGNTIPESDLLIAIEAINNTDKFHERQRSNDFDKLLDKVVKRAWEHLEFQGMATALARLLSKLRRSHIKHYIPEDTNSRRIVAEATIKQTGGTEKAFLIGHGSYGLPYKLLNQDDWEWLVELVKSEQKCGTRAFAGEILSYLLDFNNQQRVVQFIDLAFQFEEIRSKRNNWFDAIDIHSEESESLKSLYPRSNNYHKEDDAIDNTQLDYSSVTKALEQLEQFEAGDVAAWWKMVFTISVNQEGEFSSVQDFELDITQLPLWNLFEESVKARIYVAARKYLGSYTKIWTEWIFTNEFSRPELAGYKALLLLVNNESTFSKQISVEFWRNWHPIIIYCSHHSYHQRNELPHARKLILNSCYKATSALFINTLRRYLTMLLKNNKDLYDLYKLAGIVDDEFAKMLLQLLEEEPCSVQNYENIVNFLFQEESIFARKFSWQQHGLLFSNKLTPEKQELALIFSIGIFQHLTEGEWQRFWESTQQNDKLRKKVVLQGVSRISYTEANQLRLLNPEQKADLLIWLYRHFPPREDPVQNEIISGSTPRDDVAEYRARVLRTLIEEGSLESVQALEYVSEILDLFSRLVLFLNSF